MCVPRLSLPGADIEPADRATGIDMRYIIHTNNPETGQGNFNHEAILYSSDLHGALVICSSFPGWRGGARAHGDDLEYGKFRPV